MLHPAIEDVCRVAGISLGELDAIAVDVGPGLFTGLRVGVAAAKALGGALGIRLVTAGSLEVLVAACPPGPGVVVPVIDMRRGEVAWLSPGNPPGTLRVGTPAELAGELVSHRRSGAPKPGASVLLVGDGALRYRKELADGLDPAPFIGGTALAAPPVTSLAVLAIAAMMDGRTSDPAAVGPLYGRQADARINWSSREDRTVVG
jgi:tRNA threonylcarbamoyladenosine biosynthesis protein TsaB